MTRTRRVVAALIMALSAAPGFAMAAPPLTRINDVLYKADGSLFEGVAVVQWRSFDAVDGSNVATNQITVKVLKGVLSVRLVPTTTASAGAYYRVTYNSDGRIQFTETWSVPPSATPLKVRDVRVGTASAGTVAPPPNTSIQIGDVTGLPDALAERPSRGVGYLASRSAVIDANGLLVGASGTATDCVRVDGSSGPCGSGGLTGLIFVDLETPAGQLDGISNIFTLAAVPTPATSLHLYRNGILQRAGTDFTLAGAVVTFATAATPQPGDLLAASYRSVP